MTQPEPDAEDYPDTTAVDPAAAAPTELAGAADAPTQSAYAWGQADDATELLDGRRYWPGWITTAAVAASVAVIAAAAVVAWSHLRSDPNTPQATPPTTTTPAIASTSTTTTAPPPPATVTTVIVQPPPAQTVTQPAPAATPGYDGFDEQFVAILQRAGWSQDSPVFLARRGRQVCSMLQAGSTPEYVKQRIVTDSGLPWDQAALFTDTAMSVYPNCP